MTPIRIQRKRTKGWKKPDNTISVCRPGIYGNPFKIGQAGIETAAKAVELYENWLNNTPQGQWMVKYAKANLKGHNLMCFCALDKPCHADILLKTVN